MPRGLALGSDRNWNRRALQVERLAQAGGLRARRELTLEHHSLRMHRAIVGLLAEHSIQRVDQLRRIEVLIGIALRKGTCRQQQQSRERQGAKGRGRFHRRTPWREDGTHDSPQWSCMYFAKQSRFF
jgi:hypothetical protein